jgi:hypothetical protein
MHVIEPSCAQDAAAPGRAVCAALAVPECNSCLAVACVPLEP